MSAAPVAMLGHKLFKLALLPGVEACVKCRKRCFETGHQRVGFLRHRTERGKLRGRGERVDALPVEIRIFRRPVPRRCSGPDEIVEPG